MSCSVTAITAPLPLSAQPTFDEKSDKMKFVFQAGDTELCIKKDTVRFFTDQFKMFDDIIKERGYTQDAIELPLDGHKFKLVIKYMTDEDFREELRSWCGLGFAVPGRPKKKKGTKTMRTKLFHQAVAIKDTLALLGCKKGGMELEISMLGLAQTFLHRTGIKE